MSTKIADESALNENRKPPHPHIPYLSDEDYRIIEKYKHYAPKTGYELFMLDNVTCHLENGILPDWWSPNVFTFMGNAGPFIAGLVAIYHGGMKYHKEPGTPIEEDYFLPSWVLFLAAFGVQWFSWMDMMDGQRARRLKCGTPIGRIIDEAGDAIIYMWVAAVAGYVFRIPPGPLCLCYASLNLPMYTMEMRYIVTGKLHITSGRIDLGPCEVEVLMFLIFFLSGTFGYSAMADPLVQHVPALASIVPDWIVVYHLPAVFFSALQWLLISENAYLALKENWTASLWMLVTPAIVSATVIVHGALGTEVYRNKFAAFHLLHSMCFNVAEYRLMIANMTKKNISEFTYRPWGPENILAILPIVAHLALSKEDAIFWEPLVTYICIISLFVLFYGHIFLLSN